MKRKKSRSNKKGGLHEKKKNTKPNRNWRNILRLGLSYVRQRALGLLVRIDKQDRLSAILISAMLPMPLVGSWIVICWLMAIPIDWLRASLIWLFIFILAFFAGAKDWKEAVDETL